MVKTAWWRWQKNNVSGDGEDGDKLNMVKNLWCRWPRTVGRDGTNYRKLL